MNETKCTIYIYKPYSSTAPTCNNNNNMFRRAVYTCTYNMIYGTLVCGTAVGRGASFMHPQAMGCRGVSSQSMRRWWWRRRRIFFLHVFVCIIYIYLMSVYTPNSPTTVGCVQSINTPHSYICIILLHRTNSRRLINYCNFIRFR